MSEATKQPAAEALAILSAIKENDKALHNALRLVIMQDLELTREIIRATAAEAVEREVAKWMKSDAAESQIEKAVSRMWRQLTVGSGSNSTPEAMLREAIRNKADEFYKEHLAFYVRRAADVTGNTGELMERFNAAKAKGEEIQSRAVTILTGYGIRREAVLLFSWNKGDPFTVTVTAENGSGDNHRSVIIFHWDSHMGDVINYGTGTDLEVALNQIV